jgi:anaerobic magnesium-protoporphyrin IX monomethyl ester cyclase
MDTVCLIIPPSPFLLDERVFVSLGILKVAAVLESKGHTVEVLDLSGVVNFEDAVADHAQVSSAAVFGLTATTPQMPSAIRMARQIRPLRPDARLILGGPHATLVHAAFKREHAQDIHGRATAAFERMRADFDVVVAGDGEEAIFVALRPDAPSIVDADDRHSALFLTDARLNELPPPARHLVDMSSYEYFVENHSATSLIAQLGCPFNCGFCGGRMSSMLRMIRTRDVASIIEEIRSLYVTYGYTGFMFYDDELNVNKDVLSLMRQLIALQAELGTEFSLRGFIKSELFKEELAQAMYAAGFRWILVGFESGDERILTNINKRATRAENSRAMAIAKKYGIKVKALMSIGHPGESETSVLNTRDWLLEARPDDFDVTIITTYPGTPYYDLAVPHPEQDNVWVYTYEKTGDRLYAYDVDFTEVADYYKGNPDGGYKSYVFSDHLSPERLIELRDQVEREVREALEIPFNPARPALVYEHSMGQMGARLPSTMLRTSGG